MIELKDYITVIKKRYIFIIILTLAFAVLGFVYTKFTPTKYQSSINLYTNDAPDLTGYLQTNHAIDSAYKNFTGNQKYTASELSYFRVNIRSIQVSVNIVSLQITTTNQNLSEEWTRAFEKTIYTGTAKQYIQKVLDKEYLSCVKAQKQALIIDKTNSKLIPIPSCIKQSFIEYNPPEITTIDIIPSKILNIILFALSGGLLSLIIVSYQEYKK